MQVLDRFYRSPFRLNQHCFYTLCPDLAGGAQPPGATRSICTSQDESGSYCPNMACFSLKQLLHIPDKSVQKRANWTIYRICGGGRRFRNSGCFGHFAHSGHARQESDNAHIDVDGVMREWMTRAPRGALSTSRRQYTLSQALTRQSAFENNDASVCRRGRSRTVCEDASVCRRGRLWPRD